MTLSNACAREDCWTNWLSIAASIISHTSPAHRHSDPSEHFHSLTFKCGTQKPMSKRSNPDHLVTVEWPRTSTNYAKVARRASLASCSNRSKRIKRTTNHLPTLAPYEEAPRFIPSNFPSASTPSPSDRLRIVTHKLNTSDLRPVSSVFVRVERDGSSNGGWFLAKQHVISIIESSKCISRTVWVVRKTSC